MIPESGHITVSGLGEGVYVQATLTHVTADPGELEELVVWRCRSSLLFFFYFPF
jgi:hypothetical protein